LALPVWISTI